MKDLSVFLHEKTILDLTFIFSLLKRYKRTSIAITAVVFIFFSMVYTFQSKIFTQEISFRVQDKTKSSALSLLSNIGGINGSLNDSEIIDLSSSKEFYFMLSDQLLSRKDIFKYGLRDIGANSHAGLLTFGEMCQKDLQCYRKKLKMFLPEMVSTVRDQKQQAKFYLIVKNLQQDFVPVLLQESISALNLIRQKKLREFISSQRKSLQGLLEKQSAVLNEGKGLALLSQREKIKDKIGDTQLQIKEFEFALNKERIRNDHLESTYEKIRSDKKSVRVLDKVDQVKLDTIKAKITKINSDINSFTYSIDKLSEDDIKIQMQLIEKKQELEDDFYDLVGLSFSEYVAINEKTNFDEHSPEHNYKIGIRTLQKFEETIKDLSDQRESLYLELKKIDQEIANVSPTEEMLRDLMPKVQQLLILEETTLSDLAFSSIASDLLVYKRYSLFKCLALSALLSLLFIFVTLILLYLFDQKIHDENDLLALDYELEVLGTVPEFK